ncbi:MAG: hypothetical protein PHG35_05865 [Dehalococcoidales bacterium]|nr:hypothetical protein [Dehalococcoidales bacterium]
MPQLVKGGKYVFGWSRVNNDGRIVIPPEAIEEYNFSPGTTVIMISGSKTSGGFVIIKKTVLVESALGGVLKNKPELGDLHIPEGKIIEYKNKKYGWMEIKPGNTLKLKNETLSAYGIKPSDELMAIRGSGLGISLIIKGPIIGHAKTHAEIEKFGY